MKKAIPPNNQMHLTALRRGYSGFSEPAIVLVFEGVLPEPGGK